MKALGTVILIIALDLSLQGCAGKQTQQQLNDKMAREPIVETLPDPDEITLVDMIDNSSTLNTEQKAKLNSLNRSSREKIEAIDNNSLKLRSILVRDLINPDAKKSELALIQARLKGLEDRRLNVMFETVEQARRIMGEQARDNRPLLREFAGLEVVDIDEE